MGSRSIKDEEAFSAIVAHLNKLEGLDLEPEFLSKSLSGPWEILVSADCAHQFKSKFKDQGKFALHGVKYPMIVKFQTFDDKARELPQASSKSLAIAFKDVDGEIPLASFFSVKVKVIGDWRASRLLYALSARDLRFNLPSPLGDQCRFAS